MSIIDKTKYLFFLTLLGITFFGCLKKAPDAPPDYTNQDPPLTANWTIAQLKQYPLRQIIDQEKIISGVVIMDDQSGNYYKRIVLQDSTGGIEVLIDRNFLYRTYPIGRRIFIRCKGLFLSEKRSMIQLGYLPDANGDATPIPAPESDNFLHPGAFPVPIKPDTLDLYQLLVPQQALSHLNTLVVIRNMEFVDSNINSPYAYPSDFASATDRKLEDCTGASIVLRTSGYANFQALRTPQGKGLIRAVYTRFDQQPQLFIRDTADINFYDDRCSAVPGEGSYLTLQQLHQLYKGTPVNLTNYKIKGIVISDYSLKNTPAAVFVLQGENQDAGIQIEMAGNHAFPLGSELSLDINGGLLLDNYGSLMLKNIPTTQIQITGTHKIISPIVTNIAQIKAFPEGFDSRLIKLQNITWTDYPAYFSGMSGNLNLTDGTDSFQHFCELNAVFARQPLPDKNFKSLTGYIFIRNKKVFLKMRNPAVDLKD